VEKRLWALLRGFLGPIKREEGEASGGVPCPSDVDYVREGAVGQAYPLHPAP
jgi:hypothetical protein